jgi:hypothetical protein
LAGPPRDSRTCLETTEEKVKNGNTPSDSSGSDRALVATSRMIRKRRAEGRNSRLGQRRSSAVTADATPLGMQPMHRNGPARLLFQGKLMPKSVGLFLSSFSGLSLLYARSLPPRFLSSCLFTGYSQGGHVILSYGSQARATGSVYAEQQSGAVAHRIECWR